MRGNNTDHLENLHVGIWHESFSGVGDFGAIGLLRLENLHVGIWLESFACVRDFWAIPGDTSSSASLSSAMSWMIVGDVGSHSSLSVVAITSNSVEK